MEDFFYRFLSIYKNSPLWVKKTAGSLYGSLPYRIRYGGKYEEYRILAQNAQHWTKAQHEEYQVSKLRSVIEQAYTNVPFYHKKYNAAHVNPNDFHTLDDLTKFPPITREDIKQNMHEMTAQNLPQRVRLYTATSGSSGVPLELYHYKGITRAKERAFLHNLFEDFGFRPGQKSAIFRGEVIKDSARPWYYDPIDKTLILSSYLLSEKTVSDYCQIIRNEKIQVIRGYPFMIFKLVQLMQQAGELPFQLCCIILESENVYDAHRAAIENFFNCPVCHYYGHTERLVFGGNCKLTKHYHMHPEYGFLEVVDEKNRLVAEGEEGEILSTGFDNPVMPLIRYRTGDYAIRGSNSCQCGRIFPILAKIMGRAEEYVILKDGSKTPFHNLLAGIHSKAWGMAYKLQCIQECPGRLKIRVIPSNGVNGQDAVTFFLQEIRRRISNADLDLEGFVVEDIPHTKSGKTKIFVQQIG